MEKVRHFTLISNSNIDIDCTVNLITGDQKGGIWVVTQTRGIFYYNPQDSQLVNYQSDGSGTLNLKTSGNSILIRTMSAGWTYVMEICIIQKTSLKL